MKYASSTSSFNSFVSTQTNDAGNDSSFEELVSKLFSCNIVLMLTDSAKQYVKSCFGTTTTFTNVLNKFASVSNLHLTIRDLNGHAAYAFNKIRFKFFDVDQFKNRPNGTQLKKLHFDIISSMSNTLSINDDGGDCDESNDTPLYDLWKNIYIDTFELSDHDFIGSNCGCFFVITKQELPHYKIIFERLCASIKQNTSLRFIQSDFVRYFIVLSDQALEPVSTNHDDEFSQTCHKLKEDFPNSFIFYLESNSLSNNYLTMNGSEDRRSDKSSIDINTMGDEIKGLTLNSSNTTGEQFSSTDPLSAACTQSKENSTFYNELVSQRNQSLNTPNSSHNVNLVQTRDIINEWLPHLNSTQEHLNEILEALSETIDSMLRDFISNFLVSWAERQIKILGELISQRKGFRKSIFSATRSLISNMSSSTMSLTKSFTGSTGSLAGSGSGVIYIPDAQEMQQRKLADICMIFGLYEMAHGLYYSARKDFQSESAWLYYAGASEMSAISSYFLRKYQHNHLEQAINTYIDMTRSINLATRATILATELLIQFNRLNEAANLYIRLTGDDSDLRSALFLEQASRCFLAVSPQPTLKTSSSQTLLTALANSTNIQTVGTFGSRYRKAAFHFILAGHRYNRCGLRHFALTCYKRFNYSHWESASDHVNLTVAKLYLNIFVCNKSKYLDYYKHGLELCRRYSYKQIFFTELMRELKKCSNETGSCDTNLLNSSHNSSFGEGDQPGSHFDNFQFHCLEIPKIDQYFFVSLDSILLNANVPNSNKQKKHTCFVGEPIKVLFTLTSPFELSISNLKLISDRSQFIDLPVKSEIIICPPNQTVQALLEFTVLEPTEFCLLGFEYSVENIRFQKLFPENLLSALEFNSINSLPLIPFEIEIPELNYLLSNAASDQQQSNTYLVPNKVYGSEMLTLKVSCNSSANPLNWSPSSIQLLTNAKDCHQWSLGDATTQHDNSKENTDDDYQSQYELHYNDGSSLSIPLQIPPCTDRYIVSFKLVYTDSQGEQHRSIVRKVCFEVSRCLDIEFQVSSLITLRNLSQHNSLSVFDVTIGQDNEHYDDYSVSIPSNQSAHLLLQKPSIRWQLGSNNLSDSNTNISHSGISRSCFGKIHFDSRFMEVV